MHKSIDYLIENTKLENVSNKNLYNYGLTSTAEFEQSIKFISSLYKQFLLNEITEMELLSHFSHLSSDLQNSVLTVIETRNTEVKDFLVKEINSYDHKLMDSFDWDLRWIMGNSSLSSYRKQIANIVLNCRTSKGESELVHFEAGESELNKLIEILENSEVNN